VGGNLSAHRMPNEDEVVEAKMVSNFQRALRPVFELNNPRFWFVAIPNPRWSCDAMEILLEPLHCPRPYAAVTHNSMQKQNRRIRIRTRLYVCNLATFYSTVPFSWLCLNYYLPITSSILSQTACRLHHPAGDDVAFLVEMVVDGGKMNGNVGMRGLHGFHTFGAPISPTNLISSPPNA